MQEGGGVETSFKTAGGQNMWDCHGQKYGHTQGTPAETNAIRKLIPQFMSSVLNLVFTGLNMTTSAGVY